MARIESAEQLHQLELRFAACQGALQLSQAAREQADGMVKQYLELVGVLAGINLNQGDRVTIDWKSGEVTVETPQPIDLGELNGVGAPV